MISLIAYSVSLVLALIIVVRSIWTGFDWQWLIISILNLALIFNQVEIISLKKKAHNNDIVPGSKNG